MKKLFVFLTLIFATQMLYSKDSKGLSLFKVHCLSCHAGGESAAQLDYTDLARIRPIKEQLIETIKNKEMPPVQHLIGGGVFRLKRGLPQLSETDRIHLINWLAGIDQNSSDENTVFNLARKTETELSDKADYKFNFRLDIDIMKARLLKRIITGSDYLNIYEFDLSSYKSSLKNKSLAGYGFELSPLAHHFVLSTRNGPTPEIQFVWSLNKKINKFIEPVFRRKFNFDDKLIVIEHVNFADSESVIRSNSTVRLFFDNTEFNTDLIDIGSKSSPHNFIFNNKYVGYKKISENSVVKAVTPHMHGKGKRITLELYRPVLKNNIKLVDFYGWIFGLSFDYELEKPYPVKSGDVLIVTCRYENVSKVIPMGVGAEEEMCIMFSKLEKM